MKQKIYTLVFVKKQNEVLLGLKVRGFGVGLWNGFGGKVEQGESIQEGAKRELKEESNLDVDKLKHVGIVTYKEDFCRAIVHVFTTHNTTSHLKASEEMNPVTWYNFSNIPYQKMWPDAKLWYPYMLRDEHFLAEITYVGNKITETLITPCNANEIQTVLKSLV
uniref:Oxidized purine nucleoside triphosphate hydrolase n=1 Tax=Photinus pyralis TaxID=7054 RepID=A0A1Y1NIZ7_PHOPY